MKTFFLNIAFLTFLSSNIFAINVGNIEDQTQIQKNTATFSTQSMVASLTYDDLNLLTLSLTKTTKQKVKISITQNGINIFTDSYTEAQKLNIGYDLSELPKGKFIIVITQGNEKFEKQIEKTFDGVLNLD